MIRLISEVPFFSVLLPPLNQSILVYGNGTNGRNLLTALKDKTKQLCGAKSIRQGEGLTGSSSAHFSTVQLVNGRDRCEGRVEVRHTDAWGTVCDDEWDMVDANVVCRQLNCGVAVAVGSSSQFGQGTGLILLDNVNCRGNETELGQCRNLGWGVHNCYHFEDVGVTCRGKGLHTTSGRLGEF